MYHLKIVSLHDLIYPSHILNHEVHLFLLCASLFRVFNDLFDFGFVGVLEGAVCVRVILVIIFGNGQFWRPFCSILGLIRHKSCLSSLRNKCLFCRIFL